MGIGIVIGVVIISLLVAKFHGNFKLGQAVCYIFIGLLASSIWPQMPIAAHNFVTSVGTAITSTNLNK